MIIKGWIERQIAGWVFGQMEGGIDRWIGEGKEGQIYCISDRGSDIDQKDKPGNMNNNYQISTKETMSRKNDYLVLENTLYSTYNLHWSHIYCYQACSGINMEGVKDFRTSHIEVTICMYL